MSEMVPLLAKQNQNLCFSDQNDNFDRLKSNMAAVSIVGQ